MLPLFLPAVFITIMFFISSFEKIYYYPISVGKLVKKTGFPLLIAQLMIIGAILIEMIAPAIIAAYTFTESYLLLPFFQWAVIALIVFTILATLIYINPFKSKDKYYIFMSNVSTIGGLLALYTLV